MLNNELRQVSDVGVAEEAGKGEKPWRRLELAASLGDQKKRRSALVFYFDSTFN